MISKSSVKYLNFISQDEFDVMVNYFFWLKSARDSILKIEDVL